MLTINPQNAEANAALGRVLLDGTWLAREEAYRAQGLVPFEDRWVSQAERGTLIQQRAAESAAALGQREAELRLREAEARAREAEARAREAESAATHASRWKATAYPVWGGYGYGWSRMSGGYGSGYGLMVTMAGAATATTATATVRGRNRRPAPTADAPVRSARAPRDPAPPARRSRSGPCEAPRLFAALIFA